MLLPPKLITLKSRILTCIVYLPVASLLNEGSRDVSHEVIRVLHVVLVYPELPALYKLFLKHYLPLYRW